MNVLDDSGDSGRRANPLAACLATAKADVVFIVRSF